MTSVYPQPITEVSTPCFLVDIDIVRRNAQSMIDRCTSLGVKLRPHMKTHKCLWVFCYQIICLLISQKQVKQPMLLALLAYICMSDMCNILITLHIIMPSPLKVWVSSKWCCNTSICLSINLFFFHALGQKRYVFGHMVTEHLRGVFTARRFTNPRLLLFIEH